MKTLKWLFWKGFYLLDFRKHYSLELFLRKHERLGKPWKEWEPILFYSNSRKQWEIYIGESPTYSKLGVSPEELHISPYIGKIVGFTLFNENLQKIDN